MFRNYLKIAFRSLRKSMSFTALNIAGLAAGLGVCLLIVLYVTDELSYDRYNVNAGRIYRIDEDLYLNNTQVYDATASKFMGPALVASYPKIQQMVRFRNPGDLAVQRGNDHVLEHQEAGHLVVGEGQHDGEMAGDQLAGGAAIGTRSRGADQGEDRFHHRLADRQPPDGMLTKARIAQLVEQLAFNQLVLGSSPSPRTFPPDP